MIMKMPTYILQPILPTAIEVMSRVQDRSMDQHSLQPVNSGWSLSRVSLTTTPKRYVSWHLLRVNRLRLITLVPE